MNKKVIIPIFAVVVLLLIGVVAYLTQSLNEQKTINAEMQELAELDKMEMENEYQQFADQYSEMKTRINNDSLVAQLTKEQLRCAFEVMQNQFGPFEGTVTSVGLAKTNPYENLEILKL